MKPNEGFVNNTLDNFLKFQEGKKLVLFGAAVQAEKALKEILDVKNILPSYIVDNDFRRWYKLFHGYKIHEPKKLLKEDLDSLVVLITSLYPYQIMDQLEEMGVFNYYASYLFIELFYMKESRLIHL